MSTEEGKLKSVKNVPSPKCPHCGANDFYRTGDPRTGVKYIFCNKCGKQVGAGFVMK